MRCFDPPRSTEYQPSTSRPTSCPPFTSSPRYPRLGFKIMKSHSHSMGRRRPFSAGSTNLREWMTIQSLGSDSARALKTIVSEVGQPSTGWFGIICGMLFHRRQHGWISRSLMPLFYGSAFDVDTTMSMASEARDSGGGTFILPKKNQRKEKSAPSKMMAHWFIRIRSPW